MTMTQQQERERVRREMEREKQRSVLMAQGIVDVVKLDKELNLHEYQREQELKRLKKGRFGEK